MARNAAEFAEQRQHLEELLERAQQGDRRALDEMFSELRPLLLSLARKYCSVSSRIDPEDLAADVMVKLLESFREGRGPSRNPFGYAAKALRNRAIDISRRGDTKSVPVDDLSTLANDIEPVEGADTSPHVLLHGELELIRRAWGRLNEQQQEVLQASAIDGLKPREIAELSGQTANSVSVSSLRARQAFATMLRRVLLEESSDRPECVRLRDLLASSYPATSAEAQEHLEDCAYCSSALTHYAGLPNEFSAMSLITLMGLFELSRTAWPATVAASQPSDNPGGPPPSGPGSRRNLNAVAVAVLALGVIAVSVLAASMAVRSKTAGPDNQTRSGAPPPQKAPAPAPHAKQPAPLVNPVKLEMKMHVRGRSTIAITVDIGVRDDATFEQLLVVLPQGARIKDVPRGWGCVKTPKGARCTTPAAPHDEGDFVVVSATSRPVRGNVTVSVDASTDGFSVCNTAKGLISFGPQEPPAAPRMR